MERLQGAVTGALGVSAAEALSVQVGGSAIKQGDLLTVELTAGKLSGKVITANVRSLQSSFGQTKIVGTTGRQKLANARLNQVYTNQSLSQIIKDLASQAGVDTGDIETGNTYPSQKPGQNWTGFLLVRAVTHWLRGTNRPISIQKY